MTACPACGGRLERMAKLPRMACLDCRTTYPAARKHKYNVSEPEERTVDGVLFASKAEAARYVLLALRHRVGEIDALELQPEFLLQEPFTDAAGRKHRAIKYRADFAYTEGGKRVVEDVKGFETQAYRLKKKMLLSRYPDISFLETRQTP